MNFKNFAMVSGCAVLSACATMGPVSSPGPLSALPKLGSVDERFQSYNLEMVEVTGGQFWAPYGGPPGERYRQRPAEDLTDKRLIALTRHLGPAYMRVSGTWANFTYLEAEGESLTSPPTGYGQVLKRAQWSSVLDFARQVDAKVGVSMAVSDGARDADGLWKPDQAQRLFDLTRDLGGKIAFAEFINEPNAAGQGRLPANYRIPNYTRDFGVFRVWARRTAPDLILVGPGGVGEGGDLSQIPIAMRDRMLLSKELMKASPNSVDAVSYHFYGEVSQRCAQMRKTTAQRNDALTPAWLDLTLRDWRYYSALRDRFEPGDPMWVTETAQAACGGSPWAASFVDSFRYVNQLGLLAQNNVQVVMHNTLTASDYSLIEEDSRVPRPNYWAAVLWRRIMGTTVLAPPPVPSPNLRLFAHCLRGKRNGVGLAAMNLGDEAEELVFGKTGRAWVMRASTLDSTAVTVNGQSPALAPDGSLTGLSGVTADGKISVPGKTIVFVTVPGANNTVCR